MKKTGIIILLSTMFFSFNLTKSGVKRMNKTIAGIWPKQVITKTPINLNSEIQNKLSFKLGKNVFYKLSAQSKTVAYMMLAQGRGKMNLFDYMIVYKPDLSILKVKLLVYREEYGGEIGSNRWLKQFIGKSDPNKMKFGHDIQNISGATLSVRSINEGIKRNTIRIKELKEKGIF
jgi:Na+-translocating ferredoxin:NAD+ oxidoreductase RnfG subunit